MTSQRDDWRDDHSRFEWGPFLILLLIAALGIACLFYAATGDAKAQDGTLTCGPLHMVEAVLKASYKEVRVGSALVNETTVLLFYAAPEGKTFSILVLNPQGIACPFAGGVNLDIDAVKPGRAV